MVCLIFSDGWCRKIRMSTTFYHVSFQKVQTTSIALATCFIKLLKFVIVFITSLILKYRSKNVRKRFQNFHFIKNISTNLL